jgi:hypothetical protein
LDGGSETSWFLSLFFRFRGVGRGDNGKVTVSPRVEWKLLDPSTVCACAPPAVRTVGSTAATDDCSGWAERTALLHLTARMMAFIALGKLNTCPEACKPHQSIRLIGALMSLTALEKLRQSYRFLFL